jgi:hypothetical protein
MHDDGIGSKRRKSFDYIFRSSIFSMSINCDTPDVLYPYKVYLPNTARCKMVCIRLDSLRPSLRPLNALDRSLVTHADLPFHYHSCPPRSRLRSLAEDTEVSVPGRGPGTDAVSLSTEDSGISKAWSIAVG